MGIRYNRPVMSSMDPQQLATEIDLFEAQLALSKLGKIDEKVFAETRLRRGAYGQRYDNGRRHDGIATQQLPYDSLTKGPDTFWDASGMQRIKIPFGVLNPKQMELLAMFLMATALSAGDASGEERAARRLLDLCHAIQPRYVLPTWLDGGSEA